MEEVNGTFIMYGMDANDPRCLHTVEELENYVNEVGFLPLFKTGLNGFSVEERTAPESWWCGDPKRDPWEWRAVIAERGNIAYGKFFGKRAGFISKAWLPYFANARRDGYDFDALWDDGKAPIRSKMIMDLFVEEHADDVIFSYEIKEQAGFGKGGEKGFEGVLANLQMQLYLCVHDFKRKKNKKGQEYGWAIARYCTPEHIFGYDVLSAAYKEDPAVSAKRITDRVKILCPDADEKMIQKEI